MEKTGFEFEDHTADVQVRCWGESLEEAFSQAAYALMKTITPTSSPSLKLKLIIININAEDKEALLFDFLSYLLYRFDVYGSIVHNLEKMEIKLIDGQYYLQVESYEEKFSKETHEIGTEVKAITYSYMKIEEKDDYFEIRIVFDI